MNASSTDSRRVCAFRLSCFVFCEITASLPSCRPSGRSFCILVPDTPGPEFVGNSRERARRSPARGFQRLQAPLGGRSKADHAAGSFARQSAKADHVTRTSSRRSAKADCPARSSPRRSTKADYGGRLCPGGAFSAAQPAGTARFLITRGKASFYETATFGRRKVFFCSPFCGLLFCPTRAKLALPAGEKPAAPKPRPPRGGPPNDRDRLPVFAPPARTPAPATPPQSACSRRLSGCPQRPNLSARRRAESPKGKRKGGSPMKRAPPL